jgi:beta-phosphoglucomutase-like phosphatase (HAD superfamily)
VIYDLDGTLLDTEPFFIRVQSEILARFGKQLDLDVRAQMLGRPNPVAARIFV